MKQYLFLIFKIKLRNKLYSLKNKYKVLEKLNLKNLGIVLFLLSLFKLVCSVVSIIALEELLTIFNLPFLLPYVIIFLIGVYSIEEVEKESYYLKILRNYYIGSSLTKKELLTSLIVLPNMINTFFQLDTILPFFIFTIFFSTPRFIFITLVIIFCILLRNSYKTLAYVIERNNDHKLLRKIINKISFLTISFYIVYKIYNLVIIAIQSIKELYEGYGYIGINSRFKGNLRELLPSFELFLKLNDNIYFLIILLILLISIFNYIFKINRLVLLEKNISKKNQKSNWEILKITSYSGIEKLFVQQLLVSNDSLHFLFDNSEMLVTYYLIYLICGGTSNLYAKIYIFLTIFMIGNANAINSYIIKHLDFFRNHTDISTMGYWKMSKKNILDLYKVKKHILEKITRPLAIEQIILSYCIAAILSHNLYEMMVYTAMHVILYFKLSDIIQLNSTLSTFMVPFVFSRFYNLLKISFSSEYEFEMFNKIYNFYKFPMIVLTLLPLAVQVFINIFNSLTLIILISCFCAYYLWLSKEVELFLEKGRREFEKINV